METIQDKPLTKVEVRQKELSEIRLKLPYWGSYAQDIVDYLKPHGIKISTNQVYIAVNTGRGTKTDQILAAMKVLAKKYEDSIKSISGANGLI